jgi:Secretion system C-terminal sorting domain
MKQKIIIFLIFSAIFFDLKAQYIPLHLDVGTCWSYFRKSTFGGGSFTASASTVKIKGDTFINNLKYYVAEKYTVATLPVIPNPPFLYTTYYLRNDTANKLVYSYEYGKDSLLYNFNLGIGDLIPRTGYLVDTIGIDSIYGIKRKFYGVKKICPQNNSPFILIYEGIGEDREIFNLGVPYFDSNFNGAWLWVYSTNLSCSYQSKPLFGDSLTAQWCWPLGINSQIKPLQSISLYPNPTSNQFTVEASHAFSEDALIKVLDISGRIIYNTTLPKGDKKIVLNPHCKAGLYFVSIHHIVHKLIVQ